jgi:hypothetical protein
MCEQCEHLEKKISHYRGFLRHPFDPLTRERIEGLIRELEERKAMLHEAAS